MNRVVIVAALLTWSGVLCADWFVYISDMGVMGCMETQVKTLAEAKAKVETTSMKCDGQQDNVGSIILTCVGAGDTRHIYAFARTKASCESMKQSFETMLKNG